MGAFKIGINQGLRCPECGNHGFWSLQRRELYPPVLKVVASGKAVFEEVPGNRMVESLVCGQCHRTLPLPADLYVETRPAAGNAQMVEQTLTARRDAP